MPKDLQLILPSSWSQIPYKQAVNVISTNGRKIKQKEYLSTGTYPVVDQGQNLIGGYTDDDSKVVICKQPVIIFGDHTKIVKFITQDFVPGADGVKILAPKECFEPRLLWYLTQHVSSSLIDKGYSRHYQYLEKCLIPLPPFEEQKRIVAKIEELFSEIDNGIENLLKAQELLKAYRQSLLKNAFEGKLTAEWRDANKIEATDSKIYLQFILEECETKNHLKKVKNVSTNLNALPKLPSGWIWTNLDSLIHISQNGLSKRQGLNGIQTDVLRLADIKNKCIKTNNLRQIVCSESEIKKYQLFTSDILCIRVNGSTELVGQLISYQEKKKTQLFCDHFIRLRPLNSEISTYLCMYGLTDFARRFMEKNMVSTAGQNTISQFSLLQMPIPFPGKSEQKQIISILQTNLSIVDKLEENLFACTDQMKALRQSILKKAFSGELVSQDANDEPANVLLEGIKAEKEIPRSQKKKSKQLQKVTV